MYAIPGFVQTKPGIVYISIVLRQMKNYLTKFNIKSSQKVVRNLRQIDLEYQLRNLPRGSASDFM